MGTSGAVIDSVSTVKGISATTVFPSIKVAVYSIASHFAQSSTGPVVPTAISVTLLVQFSSLYQPRNLYPVFEASVSVRG